MALAILYTLCVEVHVNVKVEPGAAFLLLALGSEQPAIQSILSPLTWPSMRKATNSARIIARWAENGVNLDVDFNFPLGRIWKVQQTAARPPPENVSVPRKPPTVARAINRCGERPRRSQCVEPIGAARGKGRAKEHAATAGRFFFGYMLLYTRKPRSRYVNCQAHRLVLD